MFFTGECRRESLREKGLFFVPVLFCLLYIDNKKGAQQ